MTYSNSWYKKEYLLGLGGLGGGAGGILVAGGPVTDSSEYKIEKSLRFDQDDSTYLNKTLNAGDRRRWTWAGWIKRSESGNGTIDVFWESRTSGSNLSMFQFTGTDELEVYNYPGSYTTQKITSRKFRDTSAWYHICISYNGGAAAGTKIFVNGVQETAFGTNNEASANEEWMFNTANAHQLGRRADGTNPHFNGYLADVHWIDGLALSPAAFGAFSTTNLWNPKSFSLPFFNDNITWSNGTITNAHVTYPVSKAFDGNLTGNEYWAPADNTGSFNGFASYEPSNDIEFNQSLRIYADFDTRPATASEPYILVTTDTGGVIRVNGPRGGNVSPESTNKTWYTVQEGKGKLTKITLHQGSLGYWGRLYGVEVDGVLLVDGKTDPTTRINPNNGTTWSSGGSFATSGVNADADKLFDGSLATVIEDSGGANAEWSLTLSSAISGVTLVEMAPGGGENGQPTGAKFKCVIDGTTHTYTVGSPSVHPEWVTVYNGSAGSLTQVLGQRTSSNTGAACKGVRVNGHVLVDGANDNSCHLNFSETSSAADLGTDSFSNGNWTVNNFTVGDASNPENNDSFTDTPTNYGAASDTGAGGELRGNFPTWNIHDAQDSSILSLGSLRYVNNASSWKGVRATFAIPAGKWYWEFTQVGVDGCSYGICSADTPLDDHVGGTGSTPAHTWGGANWYQNGSGTGTSLAAMADGDLIGVAYDTANGKLHFSRNGQWYGTGWATKTAAQVAAGTDPVTSSVQTDTEFYPAHSNYSSGRGCHVNFGQRPFKYGAPTGFKTLCAVNLADTFGANENELEDLNDPSKYFATKLWVGTGAEDEITGLDFQPDLVWVKVRDNTDHHAVFDAVRGATKKVYTSDNSAEVTDAQTLKSFDSDGFTLGTEGGVNLLDKNFVGWCWDAGTSAATASTDGSINPSVQWKNATSGFSMSKYTGTGAAATIGHGLSAVPEFIIIKALTHTSNWAVYHKDLGNTHAIKLNSADSSFDNDAYWNDTSPTNTVVSIGNNYDLNQSNAHDYVMYCWTAIPGYSKFGKYTGIDYNFIHTGFKPKWVLIKSTSHSGEEWMMFDSERDPYNSMPTFIHAHSSNTENTYGGRRLAFHSNGIYFPDTSNQQPINQSGYHYLYAAFAEHPQKVARAH